MYIYLTAVIKSTSGNVAVLKSLLLDLVNHSTKEEACLQYELHQSEEDQNIFIFHETWRDQAGLDLHNQQPYIKALSDNGTIIDGPVIIYKTQKIS
jgi:quinol monooxygenase YgiN